MWRDKNKAIVDIWLHSCLMLPMVSQFQYILRCETPAGHWWIIFELPPYLSPSTIPPVVGKYDVIH